MSLFLKTWVVDVTIGAVVDHIRGQIGIWPPDSLPPDVLLGRLAEELGSMDFRAVVMARIEAGGGK